MNACAEPQPIENQRDGSEPPRSAMLRDRRGLKYTGAVMLCALGLVSACSSDAPGRNALPSTVPDAGRALRPVPSDTPLLDDRRFWYEDDSGALFEVIVLRAWTSTEHTSAHLELEADVTNLLPFDSVFDLDAGIRISESALQLSSVAAEEIPGDDRRRVRLRSSAVSQDSSITDAIITVGQPGIGEVQVPLDDTMPVIATAPRRDVVPTDAVPIGGRATYRVTSSYLYPRLHGGRPGQWRLKVTAEIRFGESAIEDPMFVRVSLEGPDGRPSTLGLQMVGPPSSTFVQTVVVAPPLTGEHRIVISDVVTGDTAELPFTLETP